MVNNYQSLLKIVLYCVTALVLSFGPFITASGQSVISTGSWDHGIFTGLVTTDSTSTPSNLSSGQQFAYKQLSDLISTSCDGVSCRLPISGTTLQNLSPQAGIQAETIAITSPYQFIRSINDGMQNIITGRTSTNIGQQPSFLMRSSATLGSTPSLSAYNYIGPFGVSFSGGGSFGNQSNAQGQTGFQLNTQQANLMIDYSFNQKLIGGFSFGYLGADRNLKLASGSLDSDSYRFAPFLLYRPTSNSYLNLMGGYALVNYHSIRSIASSDDIRFSDASAKYDSNQFFASLGGGHTLTLMNGWSLRGYGRGDFSNISIQSYQEKGGLATFFNPDTGYTDTNPLPLALQVGGQNIRSVTSTLGAELSHAISTRTFIPVIIPRLRAEWVHEFENNSRTINAHFVTSGIGGQMGVAGAVRNWANLGLGVQMMFSRSIVGYINYDRLIMNNANNNIISGGVRMNF